MSWSRDSATLVYDRGRGDAVRNRVAGYWTTAAHHAGIAHMARFAFEKGQEQARRERRESGAAPMSDAESIAFYNALKAAHPLAGEAFTQTAHADSLRQLWDTATDIGAGKEQQ